MHTGRHIFRYFICEQLYRLILGQRRLEKNLKKRNKNGRKKIDFSKNQIFFHGRILGTIS